MVITETPRSLAMSFIRVLIDPYSVYRTLREISIYDDFSERAQRAFPLSCEVLASRNSFGTVLSLDIGNFIDYRPFRVTDPRASWLGEQRNTARKTRASDHGIMRRSG
jgi:hypothetical protein